MRLPSVDEHVLVVLWVQLLVIVLAARLLGSAMRRIGQPPVVGELLAGLLLGPSVLAKAWPDAGHFLVPSDAGTAAPINAIGWLGVAFLLVLTGFETDLQLIRRLGRPAAWVSAGGLLVPLAVGLGLGTLMPQAFHGRHGNSVAFVLFIAVSLSISSLPVIAKILDELGFMRRNFGQVTVAVGMVNDLVGWLALGIIVALGRSSHLSVGTVAVPVVAIAAILLMAFTVGQRGVDAALRHVRRTEGSHVDAMAVTLLVTFGLAALTQVARSDAVLGAYIAGIIIGRSPFFQRRIRTQLESVTNAALAPLFFATAGLRIDLGKLADGRALLWAGVILLAAVATKVVGAMAGARLAGLATREGAALAAALNARGAVEVVIATVGLTIGVLSDSAYTAIVLMAIITSMMAPPLLRLIVRDWRGDPEERERLQREEALERNLLIRAGRLLLPSSGGPSSVEAARLLHAAWPEDIPVTVLSVDSKQEPDLTPVLDALPGRSVQVRHVQDSDTRQVILEESRLGYSVVGLGARDDAGHGGLLSPVVDEVLGDCPAPMVIVRRRHGEAPAADARTILVPVAGTPSSRTAQELAYALARSTGARVVLTHVVNRPAPYPDSDPSGSTKVPAALAAAASGVVEQAVTHAGEHRVRPRPSVRSGASTAEEVLREAHEQNADLIVVGTTVRRLEGRPFLGHTVEHILQEAHAEVVVVATPDALVAGAVSEREE